MVVFAQVESRVPVSSAAHTRVCFGQFLERHEILAFHLRFFVASLSCFQRS